MLRPNIVFAKQEREQGEAFALCNGGYFVKVRTGKKDGTSGVGLVEMRAIFGKDKVPAFVTCIEVECEGKTAMCR